MTRTYDCEKFMERLTGFYGSLTEARICLLEACTEMVLAANNEEIGDAVRAMRTFRFMADCIALIEEKEAES